MNAPTAPRRTRGITLAVVVSLCLAVLAVPAGADGELGPELAEVRAATARYHRVPVAEDAGWNTVAGLDTCFENEGVGAMGFHYINGSLMDAVTDPRTPESLVYAPGRDGKLKLAAVEWIVPGSAWSSAEPPTVLGRDMHLNTGLGVWVLHAWIFEHNPDGMFEDWNPRVRCP